MSARCLRGACAMPAARCLDNGRRAAALSVRRAASSGLHRTCGVACPALSFPLPCRPRRASPTACASRPPPPPSPSPWLPRPPSSLRARAPCRSPPAGRPPAGRPPRATTGGATTAVSAATTATAASPARPIAADSGERHLATVRQITFGGRERRGVLQPRRAVAHLPEHARRARLRPAVRGQRRRHRARARERRARQDHVRVVPAGRPAALLRQHLARRRDCPRRPDPSKGTCGGSTRSTCTRRGATARACGA
jgi:hypothetical protein